MCSRCRNLRLILGWFFCDHLSLTVHPNHRLSSAQDFKFSLSAPIAQSTLQAHNTDPHKSLPRTQTPAHLCEYVAFHQFQPILVSKPFHTYASIQSNYRHRNASRHGSDVFSPNAVSFLDCEIKSIQLDAFVILFISSISQNQISNIPTPRALTARSCAPR